ncbi:ribosome-inactivating family protein [Burkholderia pseudomallei]|uniref:ribosome-inactivating family protein n=1 Tax=Burkholderia pseudomallei TaxID=28450 RepID=UPI00294A1412|nr:ribosome-inactivating family protein [Burkholderia pseudomallei]CAJ9866293.1 ribosome-inactivating protein [Burkholderia pseudomallei]
MIKLLRCMCLVFFSVVFVHAHSETIDFKFDSNVSYARSISALRKLVGTELPNIERVRVIRGAPAGQLTILSLVSNSARQASLVVSNDNLYVIGFISYGNFFRFNDPEFSNITIPNTNTVSLHFSSHYSSLERVAGRTRGETGISAESLNASIDTLANFGSGGPDGRDVARALMALIISTSEAARFSQIAVNIANALGEYRSYNLSPADVSLTQNWGSLSEYAVTQSAEPNADSEFVLAAIGVVTIRALPRLLALALNCKYPRFQEFASVSQNYYFNDACPPISSIHRIGNRYWSLEVLQAIFGTSNQ